MSENNKKPIKLSDLGWLEKKTPPYRVIPILRGKTLKLAEEESLEIEKKIEEYFSEHTVDLNSIIRLLHQVRALKEQYNAYISASGMMFVSKYLMSTIWIVLGIYTTIVLAGMENFSLQILREPLKVLSDFYNRFLWVLIVPIIPIAIWELFYDVKKYVREFRFAYLEQYLERRIDEWKNQEKQGSQEN